jgi:anti-repressor protein
MQNLINISKVTLNGSEINSVNSREIHSELEIKTPYSNWIKRAIEKYGFEENQDFTINKIVIRNNAQLDYIVTLDMAKELCMIDDSDKGRSFRKYFIQCEKKLNAPLSFEELAKQTILLADKRIKELELKIENDKPLVAFGSAIAQSSATVKIGDWIKAINHSGDIKIGRNKAFEWMREHKYLTRDNMPMQQYINNGLFEVKEGLVVTDTKQIATFTTLLTGKGQMYFARKLKEVA